MPSGLIVRKKATQSLTFVYMHTHTHTHKCLFVFRYTLPAQLIYYTFVCQKLIELMTSAIDLCGTQMSMYDTHTQIQSKSTRPCEAFTVKLQLFVSAFSNGCCWCHCWAQSLTLLLLLPLLGSEFHILVVATLVHSWNGGLVAVSLLAAKATQLTCVLGLQLRLVGTFVYLSLVIVGDCFDETKRRK